MRDSGIVLGFIPARGGSKGVTGKNIREFKGKPLIAHAIDCGKESGILDRLIVSTDSQEIADVASEWGAEVPFMRPPELAEDRTPMLPVMQHAITKVEELSGKTVSALVLIDPTAPLRSVHDIQNAYKLFQESECDAVVSACPSHRSPYFNMVMMKGDYAGLVVDDGENVGCRQMAPRTYDLNTVVWVFSRYALMEEEARLPKKTLIYETVPEKSVDIDTEMDWKMLEFLDSQGRGG